ncbi:hydroxylysine kinase-like [Ptychodera flava]|uniref:hydroxylysine kinase-like n=1 Tax=Ptychodera flava TaxID=63121 RepID=UPI00396A7B83
MATSEGENNKGTVGPDEIIKPSLTSDGAKEMIQRLYGFQVVNVKQLDSYDDQNFYIAAKSQGSDRLEEYTLKVMNANDSENVTLLEAQTSIMLFLNERKFSAPKPVKLPNGKYMTLEKISSNKGTFEHMVRLLTYIPGQLYKEVELTPELCYRAGKHIGSIDVALKDFYHEGFERPDFLWNLVNVPLLEKYVYVFKEEKKRDILQAVIKAFKEHVEPNYGKLTKGTIHGDYNESNIIVTPKEINCNFNGQGQETAMSNSTTYELCGLLDYGDVSHGFAVFDLAIALAYTMMQASEDPIKIGGHMLAGYLSVFPLSALERAVVYYCITSRIAQSVTLGMYSFTLHPDNKYLLITQETGWILLEKLWSTPIEEIEQEWDKIIQMYKNSAS